MALLISSLYLDVMMMMTINIYGMLTPCSSKNFMHINSLNPQQLYNEVRRSYYYHPYFTNEKIQVKGYKNGYLIDII